MSLRERHGARGRSFGRRLSNFHRQPSNRTCCWPTHRPSRSAPTSAPPKSNTGVAPMSRAPSPEPTPVRRPVRDGLPRLQRDQLPNGLFANIDRFTTRTDPEPSATPPPETILGAIFLAGNVQPQSQDSPSASSAAQVSPAESDGGLTGNGTDYASQPVAASLPKTARKPQRGVPTQAIFGSESSASVPIETPRPVAPPPQSSPPEDRDATSKKRRRSASLPVNFGNAFKPPDS